MSPPLSEPSVDLQYSSDGFEHYYSDAYPHLVPTAAPSDFYTSGNFYMYPAVDGTYHWTDGSAMRSDCVEYSLPLYHAPTFASETFPATTYSLFQHNHFDESPQPAAVHDHSYVYHLPQQVANGSARPHAQSHRSTIALASDSFLAQASSLFSDGRPPAPLRRGSTLDHRSSVPRQSPQRDSHPPSRKRSRDSLDEGTYKGKDDDAHPSLSAPNDTCRLPQPQMSTPSPSLLPSSTRLPHFGGTSASLSESHARELLRQEERCTNAVSKYASNKRVRTSEELVRQENTILSLPQTWPIPDDQVIKVPKKPGEQKKQALACLFCRERKIACGRPHAHNPDQTCNQCARRRIKCEYPTESRRGQHKRRRKQVEGEPASQSAARTNPTSTVGSTTAPASSILMTTPASA